MRKLYTLLLLFLSIAINAKQTKKIIVTFSLNDCISGSVPLHELNTILKEPEMTIVFKGNLMVDSTLVNRKVGLHNFKSSSVIYSDSLYNKYSNGIKSTINIVEKDKKIYSADLYQLNINDFLSVYLNDENNCFKNVKSGTKFIQDDESLLVWNYQLDRWSYYDLNNDFDIIADNSWVKQAYGIYYKGTELEKKYNEYENTVKEYPALNPVIDKGIKINDNELLFMTTVYFSEINPVTNEDVVVQKIFLVNYNIQKQEISSMKYVNAESLFKEQYYINPSEFNITEEGYFIALRRDDYTKTDKIKYLALFQINKNNENELILKELLDNNIPNNYIKYKLYSNFHKYHFDKSLILLEYGEYIYDYKKNIQYKIPLPESEFNTLNSIYDALKTGKLSTYTIDDIADKGSSILLLYRDSSRNIKLMEIDKNTQEALKDTIIITAEELEPHFRSWFTINANGEIKYFNPVNNCIEIIKT